MRPLHYCPHPSKITVFVKSIRSLLWGHSLKVNQHVQLVSTCTSVIKKSSCTVQPPAFIEQHTQPWYITLRQKKWKQAEGEGRSLYFIISGNTYNWCRLDGATWLSLHPNSMRNGSLPFPRTPLMPQPILWTHMSSGHYLQNTSEFCTGRNCLYFNRKMRSHTYGTATYRTYICVSMYSNKDKHVF